LRSAPMTFVAGWRRQWRVVPSIFGRSLVFSPDPAASINTLHEAAAHIVRTCLVHARVAVLRNVRIFIHARDSQIPVLRWAFSDRVPGIERGSCATAIVRVALSDTSRNKLAWGPPSFCVSVLEIYPRNRNGRNLAVVSCCRVTGLVLVQRGRGLPTLS
jgi:hypothetical protein